MEFDDVADIQDDEPNNYADPDVEFEEECCFWLMKLLRGRNCGRKLKRRIFKYGLINFIVGFSMVTITTFQDGSYGGLSYFSSAEHGLTLISLQYWCSILAIIISFILFFAIKYWASLVTNRDLLQKLLACFMMYGTLQFIMTLYCVCVLFLLFRGVDWDDDPVPEELLIAYVFSVIFLCPYVATVFYYVLDVSYLSGEIDLRADISEPEVPEDTVDLSNVMLKDLCGAVIALPCVCCIHLSSVCDCWTTIMKLFERDPRSLEEEAERQEMEKQRRERRGANMQQAFASLMSLVSVPGRRSRTVVPSQEEEDVEDEESGQVLYGLRQPVEDPIPAPSPHSQSPRDESKGDLNSMADGGSRTLSVHQFKALWPALSVAGSFQCKLRSAPNLQTLTQHLRKQNFHIVFAASPTDRETEVSICNIRESPEEVWFMARFLFSTSMFSAVMKAQDQDIVEKHVRRFALARVLKIDTSG